MRRTGLRAQKTQGRWTLMAKWKINCEWNKIVDRVRSPISVPVSKRIIFNKESKAGAETGKIKCSFV